MLIAAEHLPQETFDMAAADDAHHRNIEGDQYLNFGDQSALTYINYYDIVGGKRWRRNQPKACANA
jgi:hypothetical protein